MARTSTIEDAQSVCQAHGFNLIQYSGKMQRLPSLIECKLCGHRFEVIVGQLKGGKRRCPGCKGSALLPVPDKQENTPPFIRLLETPVKGKRGRPRKIQPDTSTDKATLKAEVLAELIEERIEQKQRQADGENRRKEWEADPEAYKIKYNLSYAAQKKAEEESVRHKEIDDRIAAKYDEQIKLADLEIIKAQEHAQRVDQALAYQDELDRKSSHIAGWEQELTEIKVSRPVSMPRPTTPINMTLWGTPVK